MIGILAAKVGGIGNNGVNGTQDRRKAKAKPTYLTAVLTASNSVRGSDLSKNCWIKASCFEERTVPVDWAENNEVALDF